MAFSVTPIRLAKSRLLEKGRRVGSCQYSRSWTKMLNWIGPKPNGLVRE